MINIEDKYRCYKKAPTFLYNLEGDSKLFDTQESVDKAWKDGWFGPPWSALGKPAISSVEFETKREMIKAVVEDPRYHGLNLNISRSAAQLKEKMMVYEYDHEIIENSPEMENGNEQCE